MAFPEILFSHPKELTRHVIGKKSNRFKQQHILYCLGHIEEIRIEAEWEKSG